MGCSKVTAIGKDDEKTTLIAWAEEGASAGDPQDAPPLPEAFLAASIGENDWFLGEPDLVLEFDEPFCMDDDVRDIYVNIPVQLTEDMLPEDRWIQSIEYRNGPAVHHIVGGVGGLVPGAKPRIYEEGYGRLLRSDHGRSCSTCTIIRNLAPEPVCAAISKPELRSRKMGM
ncbi:MAG: hypothetical protein CM1200mP14_19460 [Gammaproteobacteria bacterium]|nr:MAG: hypothetical protein CM1200mP14_19460 [Gammaproteobacteria bacterium]